MEIEGDGVKVVEKEPVVEKAEKPKKRRLSLVVLIIGIVLLLGGGGFLAYRLLSRPGARDAEFLVEVGEWQREDAESVIWNFTEIGKGTLTTNNHQNDYDFLWSIEGDTLKIETKWLYDLNDEYSYEIKQGDKKLTLTKDDGEITFCAATHEETEPEPEF